MEIGISTATLYPQQTEDALEALCGAGVHTVEVFLNAPSETQPAFLRGLAATARQYGVHVCAVHPYSSGFEPFLFFSNYRRRFEDSMRMYEDFYRAANVLEATVVALHGDRIASPLEDRVYFERFGELSRHAKQNGVLLAQENVSRCKSHSVDFVRAMRDYLGNDVSFVLDLKQAVRAGVPPGDMLAAMGERTVHLHISDSAGSVADCLPPGCGEFDFSAFAVQLSALRYSGCGVIELYHDNFESMQQLLDSQAYLQKIFDHVSGTC